MRFLWLVCSSGILRKPLSGTIPVKPRVTQTLFAKRNLIGSTTTIGIFSLCAICDTVIGKLRKPIVSLIAPIQGAIFVVTIGWIEQNISAVSTDILDMVIRSQYGTHIIVAQ